MTTISSLTTNCCFSKKMGQYCFPMTRLVNEKFSHKLEPLSRFETVTSKVYEYTAKIFAFLLDLVILVPGLALCVFSEGSACIKNLFCKSKVDSQEVIEEEPTQTDQELEELPPVPVDFVQPEPSAPPLEEEMEVKEEIPVMIEEEPVIHHQPAPVLPPVVEEEPLPPPMDVQPSVDVQPSAPPLEEVPEMIKAWTEKYPTDSAFLSDVFLEYSRSSLVEEGRQVEMIGDIIDEMPESIQPFSELAIENCLRMYHFEDGYLPQYLRKHLDGEPNFREVYHRYQPLSPTEKQQVRLAIYNPESNIDSATAKRVVREIRAIASEMIQDREYLEAFHSFRQTII